MNFKKTPELLAITATVAAVCSTFSVGAISANATASTPADARYQQERADCLSGNTAEGRQTCLKEAGAARQAARKRDLTTPTAAQIAANERKRCEPLKSDDKSACLKRADGVDTTTSGNVAGGGDIKETVTVVPGAPDVHPESLPPTAAGPGAAPPPPPQPGN